MHSEAELEQAEHGKEHWAHVEPDVYVPTGHEGRQELAFRYMLATHDVQVTLLLTQLAHGDVQLLQSDDELAKEPLGQDE